MTSVDAQCVSDIRVAAKECLDRGLVIAAKWFCLYLSCPSLVSLTYWCRCSELLLSIPASKRTRKPSQARPLRTDSHHTISAAFSTSTPARSQSPQPSSISAFASQSPVATQILSQHSTGLAPTTYPPYSSWEDMRPTESVLELEEEDAFQAARACFETRDFIHAIHILEGCRSSKSRFLNVYCKFIVSL